ncbi:hypothetical protein PTKIN_Ptkin05aG0034900 [Pterospermum kingtungense]
MASKTVASTALLLSLNLLFFTLVSSNYVSCPPTPKSPTPVHKSPPPAPKKPASCPKDTLKLGVCADLLNVVHVIVGTPAKSPCCSLLSGLADAEAAVCLCTALKAKVLGTNLNVPLSLSLLLNYCGKKIPAGYKCA